MMCPACATPAEPLPVEVELRLEIIRLRHKLRCAEESAIKWRENYDMLAMSNSQGKYLSSLQAQTLSMYNQYAGIGSSLGSGIGSLIAAATASSFKPTGLVVPEYQKAAAERAIELQAEAAAAQNRLDDLARWKNRPWHVKLWNWFEQLLHW